MKQAAVLAVFTLIAVVAPTRLPFQWTEKCSKEFNISKEIFDNFDPLVSEWDEGLKCYTRCELLGQKVLREDVIINSTFTQYNKAFSYAVGGSDRYKDPAIKAAAEALGNCIGTSAGGDQGCERAYQYAKCIAGTVVTADLLQEFVTKYAVG